jgi:hypothetical protein
LKCLCGVISSASPPPAPAPHLLVDTRSRIPRCPLPTRRPYLRNISATSPPSLRVTHPHDLHFFSRVDLAALHSPVTTVRVP